MGERLLCKQEVIGSNPFTSTICGHHLRAPGCGHPAAFGEALRDTAGKNLAGC